MSKSCQSRPVEEEGKAGTKKPERGGGGTKQAFLVWIYFFGWEGRDHHVHVCLGIGVWIVGFFYYHLLQRGVWSLSSLILVLLGRVGDALTLTLTLTLTLACSPSFKAQPHDHEFMASFFSLSLSGWSG